MSFIFDPEKKNRLIFDGYPRTLSQAKNLDTLLEESGQKLIQEGVTTLEEVRRVLMEA